MKSPAVIFATVLTTTIAMSAMAHETGSRPAWPYCYQACIDSLKKAGPPPPSDCASWEEEALCNWLKSQEGDGGKAFERFKICNSLCRSP